MIIGEGRPWPFDFAARFTSPATADGRAIVFRMGGDVLFDCDLLPDAEPADGNDTDVPHVNQVI